MAALRVENRRAHEVLANGYFATLSPGATLDTCRIPTESSSDYPFAHGDIFVGVDYEDEANNISSACARSPDTVGGVPTSATSFGRTIRCVRTKCAVSGTEYEYTPNCWLEVGPYGGVRVWSTKDPQPSWREGPCRRMIYLGALVSPEV